MVWLEVFARGLVVQELAGAKKRRFSQAYKQVKAAVHSALVERFRHFANMRNSQWKLAADAYQNKAHDINT